MNGLADLRKEPFPCSFLVAPSLPFKSVSAIEPFLISAPFDVLDNESLYFLELYFLHCILVKATIHTSIFVNAIVSTEEY